MFDWMRRGTARDVAVLVGASTFAIAALARLVIGIAGGAAPSWFVWMLGAAAGATLAAGAAGSIVDRVVSKRLRQLEAFVEDAEPGDFLTRLPPLGPDEIGRTGAALNRLLARITTLRVSIIDQGRELAETQEELRLKAALAAKSEELGARLRERELLFDVLRVSASARALADVLGTVTVRVSEALRMREIAILMMESTGKLVVRSAHGFAKPEAVLGVTLEPGEGIASAVAESGRAIVVQDVSAEPSYLAFHGQARREGSFAALPIRFGDKLLGIMTVTRPPEEPLTDAEVRLLEAIADQAALSVRNAQLFEDLRDLSMHDELTKLANRRLLGERLTLEMERSKRFGQRMSVLVVDIDHFKELNDRSGHLVGDEALQAVADALVGSVRKVDTVARIGGEEFVVLLPRADAEEARRVAEKLRREIAKRDIPGGSTQRGGRLTVSIGVAEFDDELDEDAERLIARGDAALYEAKRRGRDRVVVAHRPDARVA